MNFDTDSITYYIDTYIDGVFFSRSEPFFDKEGCIEEYNKLIIHTSNRKKQNTLEPYLEFKIRVSLDIEEYERLLLKSKRIRVRFIDTIEYDNSTTNSLIKAKIKNATNCRNTYIKCYRYNNGFVFLNNKRNRNYIESKKLTNYIYLPYIGNHGSYYYSKIDSSEHSLTEIRKVPNTELPNNYINI